LLVALGRVSDAVSVPAPGEGVHLVLLLREVSHSEGGVPIPGRGCFPRSVSCPFSGKKGPKCPPQNRQAHPPLQPAFRTRRAIGTAMRHTPCCPAA